MLDRNFDVQSIHIHADPTRVYEFIANRYNVPKWALGFSEVTEDSALMETPNGSMKIGLEMECNKALGTVDSILIMPDGSIGKAYSRVISNNEGQSAIFSFVLMAPPVPLAEVEGTLEEQKKQLAEELQLLKNMLETETVEA